MKALFARFLSDDQGQDLIEYGVLLGLITTAVVAAVTIIGTRTHVFYTNLCAAIGAGVC